MSLRERVSGRLESCLGNNARSEVVENRELRVQRELLEDTDGGVGIWVEGEGEGSQSRGHFVVSLALTVVGIGNRGVIEGAK